MTIPLVVEPQDEDAESWTSLEGAGVVSSWADYGSADDPLQRVFAGAGAALDSLGFVADPFGAFLGSAIGYVIEHISFLHEPLDALAGDPTQITAQAQTWGKVSDELRSVSAGYRQQAGATTAWAGAAGDAYRGTATSYADALDAAATRSRELAAVIVTSGALVGTERALIRDAIADALAAWLERILVALLLAPETMGGSTAAAIGWVMWDAIALAALISDRISEVLDALTEAGGAAARIADGVRSAATALGDTARYAHELAGPTDAAVESIPAGDLVELGKQLSGTGQP